MKKVLYVTNLPAPYKIAFFDLLSKEFDLTVAYERRSASDRDAKWVNQQARSFTEIFLNGKKLGTEASFAPGIVGVIKKGNYDAVLMNGYSSPTAMLAIEYLHLHRIPFGIVCDGMLPTEDRRLKAWIKRRLIGSASYWLSSGAVTTEQLLKYGAEKEKIIWYPFSSTGEAEIAPARYDKSDFKQCIGCTQEKMILYVGQFIQRKGLDILLSAYEGLQSKPDLFLVGGEMAEPYQGEGHVVTEAFKTKDELKTYYRAADVFVLPAREDIWGLVVNEALAYGLPTISSDNCGAGLEMIQPGVNGFLFRNQDHKSLRNAIEQALTMDCFDAAVETAKRYTMEQMAAVTAQAILQQA